MRRNAPMIGHDLDEFRLDALDRDPSVLQRGGVAIAPDRDLQARRRCHSSILRAASVLRCELADRQCGMGGSGAGDHCLRNAGLLDHLGPSLRCRAPCARASPRACCRAHPCRARAPSPASPDRRARDDVAVENVEDIASAGRRGRRGVPAGHDVVGQPAFLRGRHVRSSGLRSSSGGGDDADLVVADHGSLEGGVKVERRHRCRRAARRSLSRASSGR